MGRLRGKRNRDQDRYWTEQRRAEQAGMIAAGAAVVLCEKCSGLTPISEIHKGWCLSCVCEWVDTTDPWLILQAQNQLPTAAIPVARLSEIERLKTLILEPIPDTDFLPLTQFMGHKGIGSQRSMWNFLQALYVFELETTGEAHKLGVIAPNTTHLCGRHAPVQRGSLTGFLSRIHSAGADFKLFQRDRHFSEFIRGFVADNSLGRTIFTYRRTSVDVYDREATHRMVAHYGKQHFDKYCPKHWPFEGERDGLQRERGTLDELPDVLMQIGELVPKQMPETLREDLCQDLVVAILSGEATIENLRGSIKYYVQQAFKHHPLKYGQLSLDAWTRDDNLRPGAGIDESRGKSLTVEDLSLRHAPVSDSAIAPWTPNPEPEYDGWHHGRNRPLGITSMGEQLRAKHDGIAIPGANIINNDADAMDPDIAEVFVADQHPQWRRKLSD